MDDRTESDVEAAKKRYLADDIDSAEFEDLVAYVMAGGKLTADGHRQAEGYESVETAVRAAGGIVV